LTVLFSIEKVGRVGVGFRVTDLKIFMVVMNDCIIIYHQT